MRKPIYENENVVVYYTESTRMYTHKTAAGTKFELVSGKPYYSQYYGEIVNKHYSTITKSPGGTRITCYVSTGPWAYDSTNWWASGKSPWFRAAYTPSECPFNKYGWMGHPNSGLSTSDY